jgi:hypothetical protein
MYYNNNMKGLMAEQIQTSLLLLTLPTTASPSPTYYMNTPSYPTTPYLTNPNTAPATHATGGLTPNQHPPT